MTRMVGHQEAGVCRKKPIATVGEYRDDGCPECTVLVDDSLRRTAQGRQVSEWAKKEACWALVKKTDLPELTNIPEIKAS